VVEANHVYDFGPFRIDSLRGVLLHNGHRMQVPPKIFQTLLVLVQRRGQIVEKNDFLKLVWPDAIVEESNLSQNIFRLRKILGKNPEGREYIETVPKRGYCFVSPVKEVDEQSLNPETQPNPGMPAPAEGQKAVSRSKKVNSIAVLPLFNVSGDVKLEHLCEGFAEVITNSLSEISALRVMAMSTMSAYKNQEVHPQEIGQQLDVQMVATGKIMLLDETVTIQMELVDVANGWQLWGKQYQGAPSMLVEIQQEIVQNIMDHIRRKVTAKEHKKVFKLHTNSAEAYQFYLKGRYFLNKHTKASYPQAIESFQQAINIDSKYALAYSGLADSYILYDFYGLRSPWQTVPIARAAAMMAIELDDKLAEAHTSIAGIKLVFDRDLKGAEREFKEALKLNPRCAAAHNGYSHCLIELDRVEESFAAITTAMQLAPLNLEINLYLGWHYLNARRYDTAVKQFLKTLELAPGFYRAQLLLGMAYGQSGELPTAIAAYKKAASLEDTPITSGFLGMAYARIRKREEAIALLTAMLEQAKVTYIPPFAIALIYTGLGQRNEAFEWLEKAFIEHSQWQAWLRIIPEFDSLRLDPRLAALSRRIQGLNYTPAIKKSRLLRRSAAV
jgi:DNA-binding winged helix-turn-helix (wHTH) protein/tetratricopeptide (TPR) repeat protein